MHFYTVAFETIKLLRECFDITCNLMVIHISYLQCPLHPRPKYGSCFSIASLNQRAVCVEHGPAVMITLRAYSLGQIPGNSVRIIVYSPGPRAFCSTLLGASYEVDSTVDLGVVGTMRDELVFHEYVTLTNLLQQLRVSEIVSPPCRACAGAWE